MRAASACEKGPQSPPPSSRPAPQPSAATPYSLTKRRAAPGTTEGARRRRHHWAHLSPALPSLPPNPAPAQANKAWFDSSSAPGAAFFAGRASPTGLPEDLWSTYWEAEADFAKGTSDTGQPVEPAQFYRLQPAFQVPAGSQEGEGEPKLGFQGSRPGLDTYPQAINSHS